MAFCRCPVHGGAPVCIYSDATLEPTADGTPPEIVIVEVEFAGGGSFFRFNVTPSEARAYGVVNGAIPFDLVACDIMDLLEHGCGFCYRDRRQALEARQTVPR